MSTTTSEAAATGQRTERKAKPGRKTTRCAMCGKRHRVRAAFVGFEDDALCATCEKMADGAPDHVAEAWGCC